MRKFWIILNAVCIIFSSSCFSQNNDSLWAVYNTKSSSDTIRLKALDEMAVSYSFNNPDTAIVLAEQELNFAGTIPHGTLWTANALKTIGVAYMNKGNYPKALGYYLKALKQFEGIKNKKGLGTCYINIGNIYHYQSDYPKALEYYLKSLQFRKEIGDKKGMGSCYNNIGNVYQQKPDYPRALEYFFKSLELREEIGDKKGVGGSYDNIGLAYFNLAQYPKALEYYLKSLQLKKEIGDKNGIGICYGNMAGLYNKLANYKLAILYSDSELTLCKEMGDLDGEREAFQNLADAYVKTGRYKEAYESHVKYKALTDSIFNADNNKQLGDLKTQFEVEKKETELKAKAEAQQAVSAEEKKRQQFVIYAVMVVLLLVAVFSIFLFRRVKITQKQKKIIEIQKHKVEEHQKEIIDSINYAKRIQYSLLASNDLLKKYVPDNFILFSPKDIVSGDFYWATEYKDGFYLAVCDSTGHGVPGAFMSILNMGFLSEAIKEKDITKPNEILNHVRMRLIETISKEGQKDGMDCILIRLEIQAPNTPHTTYTISYAAANNDPILLRNGKIIELEKDRMPVGKGEKTEDFTLYSIELQKGDSLILYTDGYADQFGGAKGKKFKYKPLNELLLANQYKTCHEQKDILNTTLEEWKGNLEQVDDVTIVGIKV